MSDGVGTISDNEEATTRNPLHIMSGDQIENGLSELDAPLLPQEQIIPDASSSCLSSEEDVSEDPRDDSKSWHGPLMLLFVSFLFATLNVSLRSLYLIPHPPSPAALSAIRGWMTMFMFLPILGHRKCQRRQVAVREMEGSQYKSMWLAASELAFWNFMGQALYNWGISYVPSARAAFLGQTTVVMIPVICALAGEKLRWWAGVGCLCSFIGLILLSIQNDANDDNGNDTHLSLGIGDVLILSSAVCWSFYIINISKHGHAYDVVYLQGSKNGILCILYFLWVLLAWIQADEESLWKGWQNGIAWGILTYSAFGPGVLADLIQQKGQQATGPTESNLLLCVESAFTAVLGRLLLGEQTSWIEKLGGIFLIAGASLSGQ